MSPPSPAKVIEFMTGGWVASVLGAAARNGVFDALEGNPDDAAGLSRRAGISTRGAQAMLDGMAGLGLLTISNGKYENTPEASAFLVRGKPSYLGDLAEVFLEDFTTRHKLPEAVKTGLPTSEHTPDEADNPFWHMLVTALAPLSIPVANMAAERAGVATAGPVSWLDVGGGSGVWSVVWLGLNKQATAHQLDWPKVNAIGREYVARFGLADRFNTIDGDYHTTDFGTAKYDFVIYSHIAHYEEPAENVSIFRRLRSALRPGGTLVVNDFMLDDQRKGAPYTMLFASHMLATSRTGATYCHSDFKTWLAEAGFKSIELIPTPTPATFALAR